MYLVVVVVAVVVVVVVIGDVKTVFYRNPHPSLRHSYDVVVNINPGSIYCMALTEYDGTCKHTQRGFLNYELRGDGCFLVCSLAFCLFLSAFLYFSCKIPTSLV